MEDSAEVTGDWQSRSPDEPAAQSSNFNSVRLFDVRNALLAQNTIWPSGNLGDAIPRGITVSPPAVELRSQDLVNSNNFADFLNLDLEFNASEYLNLDPDLDWYPPSPQGKGGALSLIPSQGHWTESLDLNPGGPGSLSLYPSPSPFSFPSYVTR
jgi:hypothetical protein